MKLLAFFTVFGAFLLYGCGPVRLGSSAPNDATPSGTLLFQGAFTSQNGKMVSGTASVYQQSGGGYVVRLGGISTPQESGLVVIATASNTQVLNQALRFTSGSQNYTINSEVTGTFEQVRIHSTPANLDYGVALLTKP